MHPTTEGAEASVSVVSLLGLDLVCVPEHLLLGNLCSAGEQVVHSDKIRMCRELMSVDLPNQCLCFRLRSGQVLLWIHSLFFSLTSCCFLIQPAVVTEASKCVIHHPLTSVLYSDCFFFSPDNDHGSDCFPLVPEKGRFP